MKTEAAFEYAANLGYDGVELMVWGESISQDIDAVAKLSRRYRMPVLSVHAPCLLISQRVWGANPIPKLDRSVRAAEKLGAQTVVVHPPFRWQRRYAEERQAREKLQNQLAQAADKTPDNAGKQGDDQGPLVASLQPTPLFFLNVTRGADEGSTPANRVAVSPASPLIALSLEFEKDPAFRSYRARVSDASGHVVWSAESIPSPASDAIAITLPSSLLGRGNYSVALDGLGADGRYLPTAHFSFQASLQK